MGDFKRKIHPDFQSDQTIKPTEKAAELNALLGKIHQMKCEFNEKVFVIKEEKVEVTARLEKLTKKLVDIQYLLEPSKRRNVPTIPALDTDELIIDPFAIDPKLVEEIKAKLFQVMRHDHDWKTSFLHFMKLRNYEEMVKKYFFSSQETEDLLMAEKRSGGASGSRRWI